MHMDELKTKFEDFSTEVNYNIDKKINHMQN